ncbi:hypothetical protein C8Q80DRAFT_1110145 [Daedaleopsis nitida]|nr:hypothetical protein C8Q80DRAFT_1110145 [Daedaleopsis nitida]
MSSIQADPPVPAELPAHENEVEQATGPVLELDKDSFEFFKKATGIEGEEDLKAHIVAVQREALQARLFSHAHPYPCIATFAFLESRLALLPAYDQLQELGKTRRHPIFVDIGCCLGTDVRKIAMDGYPKESILATDIVPEFWTLGHKLFNTTPATFPVPIIPGNVLDPAFLEPLPEPFYAPPPEPAPALSSVSTLNALRGHVSAVSTCALFHLLDTEAAHLRLARAIAGLLSPAPGSMVLGFHRAWQEKRAHTETFAGRTHSMFLHSPESWTALWEEHVFRPGTAKVDAKLVRLERPVGGAPEGGQPRMEEICFMEWSVMRL